MNAVRDSRGIFCAIACLLAFCNYTHAARMTVQCDGRTQHTINGALRGLDPAETNTVTVTGACHENVVVQGFDRLTLITTTGATISDASGGASATVVIEDSRRVTLQGFTIIGSGVLCGTASTCYLTSNTVQSSVANGLTVNGSSTAFLQSNVLQNNRGRGLQLNGDSRATSSEDIFRDNADSAVRVLASYFLCGGSTIESNGSDGSPAVIGLEGARLRFSCSIIGNASDGVALMQGAEGRFAASNVISGNGGVGVSVADLAFGGFDPGNSITGNLGGVDVFCTPQFSATRGTATNLGGGTTNCVEP